MKKKKSISSINPTDADVGGSLSDLLDEHVGKKGTEKRSRFEKDLDSLVIDTGLKTRLKELRESLDIKASAVAKSMNVNKSYITKFENSDANTGLYSIANYLEALGVNSASIVIKIENKKNGNKKVEIPFLVHH